MSRSKTAIYVHYVWTTHKRMPWLLGEVAQAVDAMIRDMCRWKRCRIVALGGVEDHRHLLADVNAALAPASFLGTTKAHSSGVAARILPAFRWQEGYFAESVSPRNLPGLERYIRDQWRHHKGNTLIDAWEPPLDQDD